MYSYNNVPGFDHNMVYNTGNYGHDDRIFGAGLVAPFLLGGLTGYALARPYGFGGYPYPAPYPMPYPMPVAAPTYAAPVTGYEQTCCPSTSTTTYNDYDYNYYHK